MALSHIHRYTTSNLRAEQTVWVPRILRMSTGDITQTLQSVPLDGGIFYSSRIESVEEHCERSAVSQVSAVLDATSSRCFFIFIAVSSSPSRNRIYSWVNASYKSQRRGTSSIQCPRRLRCQTKLTRTD